MHRRRPLHACIKSHRISRSISICNQTKTHHITSHDEAIDTNSPRTSAHNILSPDLTERSSLRLVGFPGTLVLVVIGLLHFSAASVSSEDAPVLLVSIGVQQKFHGCKEQRG